MKKNDFTIEGYFYKKEESICRKALLIKKNNQSNNFDLLVIMMNPSASKPEGTEDYSKITDVYLNKLVKTKPDITQNKIMEFMKRKNFTNACVLNITDICNPQSNSLTPSNIEKNSNFGSIENAKEFINQYAPNVENVVIAWGCNSKFKELIKNAIAVISSYKNIYGFPKYNDKSKLYFYHPLVRNQKWAESLKKIKFDEPTPQKQN